MSLAIDVDDVTAVLLAGTWHEVADDSFSLDAYEFVWSAGIRDSNREPTLLHGGGHSGVCATGFAFLDAASGQWMNGPLTAVQAVRRRAHREG